MSKLFLGVDGGGSKTELCVADGSGKTLLTLNGGATSFKSVGNAAAFANMRELVRQMERAGFRAEHIQRSVWGMSGCDTPADRVVYEAMIQQAGFPEALTTVVNDALLPSGRQRMCPAWWSLRAQGPLWLALIARATRSVSAAGIIPSQTLAPATG